MKNKIPNKAYFYWGGGPLSFLRYMTLYSFLFYNPDCKAILIKRKNPLGGVDYGWEESQDFMAEGIRDYSDRLVELPLTIEYLEDEYSEIAALDISDVHTSDILAWYIMARKGGMISDMDILYVKKFDWDKYGDAEFGMVSFESWPKPNYMPVSFMIGQPNEIYEEIYQASLRLVDKTIYQSAGTSVIEKTLGDFEDIKRKFTDILVTKLPDKIVFPFAKDYEWGYYPSLMFSANRYGDLSKDTIGIHWYAGHPVSQKCNLIYNHENYSDFNNTISSAIGACWWNGTKYLE